MIISFRTMKDAPAEALSHVDYADHRIPLREPQSQRRAWPRESRLRRQWQGDFVRWYLENAARFSIGIELLRHAGAALHVGFHGISRVVTADVYRDEITICVAWRGFVWDIPRFRDVPATRRRRLCV